MSPLAFGIGSSKAFGIGSRISGPFTSQHWLNIIGNSSSTSEDGVSVAVDTTNSIYIAANSTNSSGYGNQDMYLMKFNDLGVLQWQRVLGSNDTEVIRGITTNPFNNDVYIVGELLSGSSFIAKYNSSGTIQWQRAILGTSVQSGFSVNTDSSGNVYMTGGSTSSGGAGGEDLYIAKFNSFGTLQWIYSLGGTGTERGYGIAVSSTGNSYVTGYSTSSGGSGLGADALITKYSTSGNIFWQRSIGIANAGEFASSIALDSSENCYITGYTNGIGAGNDVFIVKYNSSGILQWQRALGGSANDQGIGIAVDSSSNVYIAGMYNTGTDNNDMLIVKYDTSGTLQWQRTIGRGFNDNLNSIAIDSNGNLCMVGRTFSTSNTDSDIILLKLPSDGSKLGTHNGYTYQQSSLTSSTSTMSDLSRSLTSINRSGNGTLSVITSTVTEKAGSLATNLTYI